MMTRIIPEFDFKHTLYMTSVYTCGFDWLRVTDVTRLSVI